MIQYVRRLRFGLRASRILEFALYPLLPLQPPCNVCATSLQLLQYTVSRDDEDDAGSDAAGQSFHALSPAPLPPPARGTHPHSCA